MTTANMIEPGAMPISMAIRVLKIHVQNRRSVMIWGAPGIGKTQIPSQVAAELNWPLIDWRANLRDPVDARGLPVPDMEQNITRWLQPSELPINGRHGPNGILLLDEINTASPAMQNVCLQVALEKRIGEHVINPGWVIVATGNRAKDKAIVGRMSSALKNRFAHITMLPEIEAFASHAIKSGIDPYLIAFLRFRNREGFLHRMPVDDTINAYPTPRKWFEVNENINLPSDIRPYVIGSQVGEDIARELEGFLRVVHELPTLEDVKANPATAKLPVEPAAKYAVAGMLARGACRKSFGRIITYAKRLDREYEMLTVQDSVNYTSDLKETSEYGAWCVANKDLAVA